MAYVSTASHDAFHGSAPAKTGEKPGFLVAIEQANMRRAEREIANHFAIDAKFTDEVEREIERRFLANPR